MQMRCAPLHFQLRHVDDGEEYYCLAIRVELLLAGHRLRRVYYYRGDGWSYTTAASESQAYCSTVVSCHGPGKDRLVGLPMDIEVLLMVFIITSTSRSEQRRVLQPYHTSNASGRKVLWWTLINACTAQTAQSLQISTALSVSLRLRGEDLTGLTHSHRPTCTSWATSRPPPPWLTLFPSGATLPTLNSVPCCPPPRLTSLTTNNSGAPTPPPRRPPSPTLHRFIPCWVSPEQGRRNSTAHTPE